MTTNDEPAADTLPSWDWCCCNDATVRAALCNGASAEDIVRALVAEKQRLVKSNMELNAIAPFAVKTKDGGVIIWNCPDHLVPVRSEP